MTTLEKNRSITFKNVERKVYFNFFTFVIILLGLQISPLKGQIRKPAGTNIDPNRPLPQQNVLNLDISKGCGNTIWQDQSSQKNNVTLTAFTHKTPNGLYFNGNNNALLAQAIPLSNFTVYMNLTVEELGKTLLGTGQGSEYGLHYQDNALYTATDQPFSFFNSGALPLNKSIVIALVRDVTKNDGNVSLYIDATLVGTFPAKHIKTFNLTNIAGETGFLFKGWIRKLAIYNVSHELPTIKSATNSMKPKKTNVASNYIKKKFKLPFAKEAKEYYVQKDGHYFILNGDIVVGDDFPRALSFATDDNDYKWPNAKIPVVIDESIFTNNLQDIVFDALDLMNSQISLKIVPRTTERDYITIRYYVPTITGEVGRSPIGKQGGEQFLSVTNGIAIGNILHEMFHAAGINHEQNREDRDDFVNILWDNIPSNAENNFEEEDGISFGPYDFCSIMHYGSMTLGAGRTTIECVTDGNKVNCPSCMGQRTGYSAQDISGINQFYNVSNIFPSGFKFERPSKKIAAKYYHIQAQNGQYMTVKDNGQSNGTPVILAPFKGDLSQKWEMTYNTNTGNLFLKTSQGRTLDILGNGSNNGTLLQLSAFDGNPAQRWQLQLIGGDVKNTFDCYIQSTTGMRTVDFCNPNMNQLYIWNFNETNCQKWKMIPCAPPTK
jgi:Astacin (Peptidase family M12A)/Ricin-type beta-trefoil lectin domain-like